jgi:hypothetical protein
VTAPSPRLDWLLLRGGIVLLFVVAFRFPWLTALGVIASWEFFLRASRVSPSVIRSKRGKDWTQAEALERGDFLRLLAADSLFALSVFFLLFSGMASESQEAPLSWAALLELIHFFVGFALLLSLLTYGTLKVRSLLLLRKAGRTAVADMALEQATAIAMIVFLAFGLQLLPAIVPVAAPLGLLGFVSFVGLFLWVKRRRVYSNLREQVLGLLRALATAPVVLTILMFFLASPVRTHFIMDIGYEMHFMFAAFAVAPVLSSVPLAWVDGGFKEACVTSFRLGGLFFVAFVLFILSYIATEAGVTAFPLYETLLPPATR